MKIWFDTMVNPIVQFPRNQNRDKLTPCKPLRILTLRHGKHSFETIFTLSSTLSSIFSPDRFRRGAQVFEIESRVQIKSDSKAGFRDKVTRKINKTNLTQPKCGRYYVKNLKQNLRCIAAKTTAIHKAIFAIQNSLSPKTSRTLKNNVQTLLSCSYICLDYQWETISQ